MEKTSEKHIQGNMEIPERQHPLSTADDRGRWRAGDAATTETVYYSTADVEMENLKQQSRWSP